MVLVVVGRQARQHLVEEHSKRPPVDLDAVALCQQDFWCKVFGRAAEGWHRGSNGDQHEAGQTRPVARRPTVRPVRLGHVELAQAKVAQRNVPVVVEEDVLWLEVAVDDVEGVEVLEGAEQLGRVEA